MFVAWGPFADPEDQLNIVLTDDTLKKKGDGTRKQLRSKEKEEKELSRENDTLLGRGLSTSQEIEMEHLKVQRQMMIDRQNETSIVALSIEEAAISRQLSAAETRAETRCPIYDINNSFWKWVDTLIVKKESVMDRIGKFTAEKAKLVESDQDKILTPSKEVSPMKRKAIELVNSGDDEDYDCSDMVSCWRV